MNTEMESPGLAGAGARTDSKTDATIIAQPAPVAESAERYGAHPEDWIRLQLVAGIGEDLLPVVSDPNAKRSPGSKVKKPGKVPTVYNGRREFRGIVGWTGKRATSAGIARWSSEPDYGICVQTRLVRAIDGDINDAALAAELERVISDILGPMPTRRRVNSPRFLKAFILRGEYPKRTIRMAHGIIEFLGNGQQFVAAGTHESGARYVWDGGNVPDEFPVKKDEQFEELWTALERYAIEPPAKTTKPQKSGKEKSRNRAEKLKGAIVADPVVQHLIAKELVKSTERDGRLHIECPWQDLHTSDTGVSATTYWPAHTGGFERGHFKCLHAHCEGRTDADFLEAIGFTDPTVLNAFEECVPAGEKQAADLGWIENFKLTEQEVNELTDPKWIYENLLIQGHLLATPGAPGAAKTTIWLHIAGEIAVDYEVCYVMADVGSSDIKLMQRQADEHGFHLLLPDMKAGLSMQDVVRRITKMNEVNADYSRHVFIFDTLKKMTDVINKTKAKELYRILRGLTAKGMTVVLLAHTNKYNDAEGLPVYEGTGDLRADVDELIYFIPKKNPDGSLTVSTDPLSTTAKRRGTHQPITFNITRDREVSRADYVNTAAAVREEKQREEDAVIIEAITQALQAGKCKHTQIVAYCKERYGIGRRSTEPVLRRYRSGPFPFWERQKSLKDNAWIYELL